MPKTYAIKSAFAMLLAAAAMPAGCATQTPQSSNIIPRCAAAPAVDGRIDDACWRDAMVVRNFSRPSSDDAPAKRVEARLLLDDKALYVAFRCQEPNPSRIVAGVKVDGAALRTDDCVEINIRTSRNRLDRDVFGVSTIGTRSWVRQRGGVDVPVRPSFHAKAAVGNDHWTAEMAIPYGDLGLAAPPVRGDMLEVKLGRIDHAADISQTCVWPAGAKYEGVEDFAPAWFADDNLLKNSAMTPGPDGVACWDKSPRCRITSRPLGKDELRIGAGRDIIRVDSDGRPWTATQSVVLRPNRVYRLSALARGYSQEFTAGVRLAGLKDDSAGRHAKSMKLEDNYASVELTFSTDSASKATVGIGASGGAASAYVELADIRLVEQPANAD